MKFGKSEADCQISQKTTIHPGKMLKPQNTQTSPFRWMPVWFGNSVQCLSGGHKLPLELIVA